MKLTSSRSKPLVAPAPRYVLRGVDATLRAAGRAQYNPRMPPFEPVRQSPITSHSSTAPWSGGSASARLRCCATPTAGTSGSASSTGRSRPTTRWACTTAGAGRSRTSGSATTPCWATISDTRTVSTARACGSRSGWRRSSGSTPSPRSRSTGSSGSRSPAVSAWPSTPAQLTEHSKRLGQWMDWDKSYYTMTDPNISDIWRFLKRCHDLAGCTGATGRCPGVRAAAPRCPSTS